MELVECLWDVVENRQINCNVYIVPLMEVHSGITETPDAKGKTSKTELLFVEKPSHTKLTNLSPIILEEGRFIPVVNKIFYLGSIINHNLREPKYDDISRSSFWAETTL